MKDGKIYAVKDKLLEKIDNALDEQRKLSSKEYLNYAQALSFIAFLLDEEDKDDFLE